MADLRHSSTMDAFMWTPDNPLTNPYCNELKWILSRIAWSRHRSIMRRMGE